MRIVKKDTASITAFDQVLMDNQEPNRLMSLYIENIETSSKLFEYALFFNTTAPDSIFVGLIEADNAVLRVATSDDSAYIKVNVLPLPLTSQNKSFEGWIDAFVACFFIAIAFAFIPSSMIMYLVMERSNNAKHQ